MVVIINNILRMVDAFQIFPWQAQPLGALRSRRDQDGLNSERAQIIERQIAL